LASLYSNENVPLRLVDALRALGHQVLTSQDAGNANQAIPDRDVLDYAFRNKRIVLTGNRDDFHKLHKQGAAHSGIVTFTEDADLAIMAARVDAALSDPSANGRFCARVTKGGHTIQ
jgi:hypothetical protein